MTIVQTDSPPCGTPRSTPLRRALVAGGIALAIWTMFSTYAKSEYTNGPIGDAAFYTDMTATILTDQRGATEVSSMHGKRVLGPFLAALVGRAIPLNDDESPGDYRVVHRAWKILNGAGFVLLAMTLALLIPPAFDDNLWSTILLNLLLTPSMGLLSVFWPQMNDILALLFFTLSLLCTFKLERPIPGMLCLAIASLAREQVLLLIPCVVMFTGPRLLLPAVLAAVPYVAITYCPLFPNAIPLIDHSSGAVNGSTSTVETYGRLFTYHWNFLWSPRGIVHPCTIVLNVGTSMILVWSLGLWRRWRFLVLLAATVLFMADRHMVFLGLIALAALNLQPDKRFHSMRNPRPALVTLLLAKLVLLLMARTALWLQAEHWHRLG